MNTRTAMLSWAALALAAAALVALLALHQTAHAQAGDDSQASAPESDRTALVALYKATGGANWDHNTNWLTDGPLAEWHGVTTAAGGRVVDLYLPNTGLSGEIPPDLGRLASLRQLRLSDNGLSGEIPSELGDMSSLRFLSLHGNMLNGEIPASLEDLPWVQDGITEDEMELIRDIRDLMDSRPEIADSIITVPDRTGEFIRAIMSSVRFILREDESRLEQLGSQSWFQDGLTGEEAALIVVLRSAAGSEEVFEDLLQGSHVRSETISLPLAGEVDLFAVGRSEFELGGMLERMGLAVESMEGFMGTPWPKSDVMALLELESDLGRRTLSGSFFGDHVVVKNTSKNTTYHELAHFYFGGNVPGWLTEGAADFLMLYTLELTRDENLISSSYFSDQNDIARDCAPHGSANVQGWIETNGGGSYCPYFIGRRFLAGMYRTLGHEVVSSALRELYERGRATGRSATEDEIYQAFLTNTPPSQRDKFRVCYHRLHGKPIPGYTATPKAALSPEIRDVLVTLYNATDGPGWENSEKWLSEAPLDQWYGVFTDCDGTVPKLVLNDNQLSGPIPPELGGLTNLEGLDLYGNQLTGAIPAELGGLTNLQGLYLYGNQLTGAIPAELGSLTSLQELYLYGNQLTGEIPAELGSLTNLEWLYLSSNELTGEIPAELGSLTNLELLYLHSNELTGEIPAELGGLTNLERLSLSRNELTGEIPAELGGLTNLEVLYLHSNQLTGEIPAELGSLTNLEALYLFNNQLTGEIPAELGSLTNLEVLSLYSNQLTGEIPAELGSLTNLEVLSLYSNQLTGTIPAELGSLTNLERLYLSYNQLTGTIPPALGSLTNLERLYLSYNQLTGTIPPALGSLTNLEWLNLSGNQLTGCIPQDLGGIPQNDYSQLGLPLCDMPGALTITTPISAGDTSLTVAWTVPINTGTSAINAYDLRYIENGAADKSDANWTVLEDVWTTGTDSLEHTLTGLTDGTQYDVQVRAVNSGGDGTWSVTVTGTTTSEVVPGAPTGLTATANGPTQIDLSWSAPASDGGSAITGYRIEVSENRTAWSDLEADTGSTSTSYSHTGLAPGSTRHYRVSAINSARTGPASNVATGTTSPAVIPGAPTGLTTAVSEDGASVELSWIAPTSTGGARITGYWIESSPDGANPWTEVITTTGDGTTYTDDGTDANGPMFSVGNWPHYRVAAVNQVGTGPFSEPRPAAGDSLFSRYDTNGNDMIDKAEVINAINDYLFGEGDEAISKADVIELINLYLFG